PAPFQSMRSFFWLGPALVLTNTFFGPAPRIWGLFSKSGLLLGVLVFYRLTWAAWIALVLIRTCPAREFLFSFRSFLGFFHIPDRNISLTLFLTLEMLPQFADIRVNDFHNLPEAIARRIRNVVLPVLPDEQPETRKGHLKPADAALAIPAAGLIILAALI
ncbi:hypothetical protein CH330_05080, partial [candidate division WOR-3 bacterium JGI_Cruoil_03_51_56]